MDGKQGEERTGKPATPRGRSQLEPALANLGWVIGSVPAALLVVQLVHALLLRSYLQHWPIAFRDNPTSPLLEWYEYGVVFPVLYAALFGVPVWLVGNAVASVFMPRARPLFLRQLLLTVLGSCALGLFYRFDPIGYAAWFLD